MQQDLISVLWDLKAKDVAWNRVPFLYDFTIDYAIATNIRGIINKSVKQSIIGGKIAYWSDPLLVKAIWSLGRSSEC